MRSEDTCPHEDVYGNVLSSFIYNKQKWKYIIYIITYILHIYNIHYYIFL